MPGFVDPDESESRQSLYRDLLSHLNETIFGSPSTLPYSESGQYTLDFNPVEAFDKSKNPEGAIYAEPQLNWVESAISRGGPGWQSRTLDWLAGRLGKAPKQATVESWISKAKGAGLPTEERDLFARTLEGIGYKAKDRVGAERIAYELEYQGLGAGKNLPMQGIYTKELSQEAADKFERKVSALQHGERKLSDKIYRFIMDTKTDLSFEDLKNLPPDYFRKRTEGHKITNLMQNARDTLSNKISSTLRQQEGTTPKWSQYKLDEVTSPREILYKAKGSTYNNSDIETHYPGELGKGLQWHQREGKLKFAEGESTHLSEQQSDLASEYAKGIAKHKELLSSDPKIAFEDSVFNSPKPTLHENWYKTGFRDLVNRAVQEDSKFVSWDSAAVQKKRWPAGEGSEKFFDKHYDQSLVNFVKKEYGVTPEKVNVPTKVMGKVTLMSSRGENIERPTTSLTMWRVKPEEAPDETLRWVVGDPDFGTYSHYGTYQEAKEALDWLIKRGVETKNNEVWRIPITDEMKRKVLLEGQYFSKKDEDNAFRRPYEIG